MQNIVLSFLVGGTVTSLIVGLEERHLRLWSGLAALLPVFTIVSYFFIGATQGGIAVGQHSRFVLVGTLVSWVPYMVVVAWLAPILGANRGIGAGLLVFLILATAFVITVDRYKLFA